MFQHPNRLLEARVPVVETVFHRSSSLIVVSNSDSNLRDLAIPLQQATTTIAGMASPESHWLVQTVEDGTTLLCNAAERGSLSQVRYLTNNGANVDEADQLGLTPLCLAAVNGRQQVAAELIESKADIDLESVDGHRPLGLAMRENHVDAAKLLIRNGANADVIIARSHGMTPLGLALSNRSVDTAEALIAAGADVNMGDSRGMTPLCWAAFLGHTGIAERLIQNGADISKTDNQGWSPMEWARWKERLSVELLLSGHADKHLPLGTSASRTKATTAELKAGSDHMKCRSRDDHQPFFPLQLPAILARGAGHLSALQGADHAVEF